jgi:hypothetical protein
MISKELWMKGRESWIKETMKGKSLCLKNKKIGRNKLLLKGIRLSRKFNKLRLLLNWPCKSKGMSS